MRRSDPHPEHGDFDADAPPSAPARPSSGHRLVLVAIALVPVAVLCDLAVDIGASARQHLPAPAPATAGAIAPPRRDDLRFGPFMQRLRPMDLPSETVAATSSPIPPALAQIYARRGAQTDGCRQKLPDMDAAQEGWLAQADALLALDQALPSTHRPTLVADGRMCVAAAPSASFSSAALNSAIPDAARVKLGDAPSAPASVQHDLRVTRTQVPHAIIGAALDQTVVAADTWAAIAYHPDQVGFEALTLHDATSTGHALCLYARDFASIRVNGGLVVPGRFYLIGDHLCITSTIPVQVLIRPLSALATYYPSSARLPSADG